MDKIPRFARTTISVPFDLKRRMAAITEAVNWSAIACRAFEATLAEIAARKERKVMDDVVQRLRASKQRIEDEQYQEGEEAGRRWAENEAEADELSRLEQCRQGAGYDWARLFYQRESQAYSADEWLFFRIRPEFEGDREEARLFWEDVLGEDAHLTDIPSFVQGFAEGALGLWGEVKDRL
jgi:hypothetical protein